MSKTCFPIKSISSSHVVEDGSLCVLGLYLRELEYAERGKSHIEILVLRYQENFHYVAKPQFHLIRTEQSRVETGM